MHKSDVEVLQILAKNECTSEIKSYSILSILSKTKYKYSKIHNTLSQLAVGEYVQKGFKNERADTFYITPKGMDKLRRLLTQ
jgi:DNA-binding MarR family transcriptional regulator